MLQSRNGIYRGIVVYNKDPLYMGRVKIYVPGIYPILFKDKYQLLPWALPAMSLFCGGWKNLLNPYVNKEQAIDFLLYNNTDDIDNTDILQTNNYLYQKSATSDPSILYDSKEIGNAVLNGANVLLEIKKIKGER